MKRLFLGCLFVFVTFSLYAQSPVISYPTVNIFTVNQAISPLLPTNDGGSIPSQPIVSTFAGSGVAGAQDSTGANAAFNLPTVVTLDNQNNLIVVDRSNHKIRKITPQGEVTTLAGTGIAGAQDGPGNAATFRYPDGAVVDSHGNIFVTDQSNHKIRKIDTNGVVSTFAGTGVGGFQDGTGSVAKFFYPAGMAIDANDNLYIADYSNHKIRMITPAGMVSTYAGTFAGNVDGDTATARFNGPTGVCLDSFGNVYVADYGNHKIRKISTSGTITTFAGNGTAGAADGVSASATFYHPAIVAADSNNELFVTDQYNHKIRKISPEGVVTTYAGTGEVGSNNDKAILATFNSPTGIVVDPNDRLYIADYANHKIRKIQAYGYTISPNLPAGLQFNKATGAITGQPLEVTPATDYVVTAENQDGSSSFTFSIEVQANLAVNEVADDELKAFPNPVKEKFTISGLTETSEIVLLNVLGQTVKKMKTTAFEQVIEVAQWESGMYLCRITSETGMKEIKILKQ
ncbi:T9SS type A sorting domain-containing protein [Flavobacterium suncheonense]|uniref:T9SS type A sorting domain-containing protein n=1 Tax=Flavobacterium suncheonense TaxID=350894 RepID=UPI00040F9FF7|nr:T9SS type A sorting domain-containing protein [Flavobacterium suncheonense]